MTRSGKLTRYWAIAVLAVTGMFLFLTAAGVIPVNPDSVHAPSWVLAATGVALLIAAVMVRSGRRSSRVNDLLAALMIGCMAAISSWIAFAPGERHFGAGGSFGSVAVGGSSGASLGRVAFGISAVMLWAMVLFALRQSARRLRG